MSAHPPRIVLDSNVCLDLFAFQAPDLAPLLDAVRSGAIEAVTDADCRAEWQRVLTYPQLKLDPAARERSLLEYDRWLRVLAHDADAQTVALPRCADPDDQKFLGLALASNARWLLTRDHALLVLGRRTARAGLFEILTARAWVALQNLRGDAATLA